MSTERIDQKAKDFLEDYLNTYSPTGMEEAGQRKWLDYIEPYIDEHLVDDYGSVAGVIGPGKDRKVVIEAHADEISWRIHYITDEGFLYVTRNGGSDHQIAPSKRVRIHTAEGTVPAVFGWPAIHTRDRSQESGPKAENIFLDAGCDSKEELEKLGVHVGCLVTYEDGFDELNDRYYMGRALDNRIGGFAIAEVVRGLKEEGVELPFTLYVVNAVQEEVGARGAGMISEHIEPDIAIVTDVCHDTRTPMIDRVKNGDIKAGNGPVFTYAPSVQNNLLGLLIEAAQEEDIAFQRRAASRATGTDTDAFAYSIGGVPSALIQLPQRYMHTTVEMVHKHDLQELIRLISASLKKIEADHDLRYLK